MSCQTGGRRGRHSRRSIEAPNLGLIEQGCPAACMKRKILASALSILFILIYVGASAAQENFVLEVLDFRQDRSLLRLKISAGDEIHLRTIHSLALTPYTHIYTFDNEGNLTLSGAIFESGGGGFPEGGDGVWSVVDGKFRVDQINRFVGKLRFRVSPLSRETLVVSSREFPLYEMVPEGTLVELKVCRERSAF
jgi:hypothetical protein